MSAEPGATAGVNIATYFLDRNLREGRGGRTALIEGTTECTYAELAALTNQAGNALLEIGVRRQERVLFALADSIEFVATWYATQKIGAVTAEVYTFLQPKDYAYYVDYTGARVVVAHVFDMPIVGLLDASFIVDARTAARLSDEAQAALDAEIARVRDRA